MKSKIISITFHENLKFIIIIAKKLSNEALTWSILRAGLVQSNSEERITEKTLFYYLHFFNSFFYKHLANLLSDGECACTCVCVCVCALQQNIKITIRLIWAMVYIHLAFQLPELHSNDLSHGPVEGSVSPFTLHQSGSWGSQGTDEKLLRWPEMRWDTPTERGRKSQRETPQDRRCLFSFPFCGTGPMENTKM